MVSFRKVEHRRDDRIAGIALTSAVPLVDALRCWFRGPESEFGSNELRSDASAA